MKYIYRDTEIFYEFFDRSARVTNVYLHGWGCDHKSLLFCDDLFENQNGLFVDFPPFGESSVPKGWSIFTYANMLISLCCHLKIKNVNLFGHSFGGRVAILFSVLCKNEVEKLILIDSAGLKPKRGLGYYKKVWVYKLKRKLHLDVSNYGSCDYRALDENMKKVFKSVVNTHLDDFLPFVRAKTLIVFGKDDKVTPAYMAKRFKRKIKNSQLVLLEGAGHFCYVDRKIEFVSQLEKFLEG